MIQRALKLLRKYHNRKQKDLAAKLGISPSHLCEIEAGTKPVSYDLLERYASEFRIPVSTISLFAEASGKSDPSLIGAASKRALRFLEWLDEVTEEKRSPVENENLLSD